MSEATRARPDQPARRAGDGGPGRPASRALEADRVRMRCPACEAPAEWAGQKWRCRRCGWLSS